MSSMTGMMGYGGATGANAVNSSAATGAGMGNKIPKGYQLGGFQRFSPEQMQLFQSLFGNVGPDSYLSKLAGGDQTMFNQLEAPALRQFGELQGNIASRFSGMGTGARRSSGFQNTMSQAGQDFAQQLQSQRMGLQRQAMQDLMGFSQMLMGQQPNEQFLMKKQKPWWQELLLGINERGQDFAQTAGKLAGAMI